MRPSMIEPGRAQDAVGDDLARVGDVDDLGLDAGHRDRLAGVRLEPLAVVAAGSEDLDRLHGAGLLRRAERAGLSR